MRFLIRILIPYLVSFVTFLSSSSLTSSSLNNLYKIRNKIVLHIFEQSTINTATISVKVSHGDK